MFLSQYFYLKSNRLIHNQQNSKIPKINKNWYKMEKHFYSCITLMTSLIKCISLMTSLVKCTTLMITLKPH